MGSPDVGVVILAGGAATRFPGKLQRDFGQLPMIVRVYRNVSAGRPTVISCSGSFPAAVDAQLPCPMVVDRWPGRGPLGGMLSALSEMRNRYVFAVAGDAPFVTAAFIDRLAAAIGSADEAVVPRHAAGIEPLAAIYKRTAFLRAAVPLLASGGAGLRHVVDRLATKFVHVENAADLFVNINTPADYAAAREARI